MLGRYGRVLLLGLLLGCLGVPPAWSQGQLINGNRTITGTLNACVVTTGSVNTYLCPLDPPITAYVVGQCFRFTAHAANTGAAVLNVNGAGPKPIKKYSGGVQSDLLLGDVIAGQQVQVCYDGVSMQAQSLGGGGGGGITLSILDEGSPQPLRSKLNFVGAGVGCIDNPGLASTDCTIPGASAAGGTPYGVDFTSQTTLTVPGATHGLGTRDLHITVYDTSSPRVKEILPNSKEVNPSTFDVVVTFAQAQSGRLVVSAASSAAGTGMADPGSNGLVVRTAALTTLARTLTGTGTRIVVTNGTGVTGNPTVDIGSDVATLSGVETFTGVKTFSGVNLGTNTLRTTYPNDVVGGTTNGFLTGLVPLTTPATARQTVISGTGSIGVVVSGGGISGNVQVATTGQAACTFENDAISGNLVVVGTSIAGTCRDSGVNVQNLISASLQIVGRALESGTPGLRQIQVWGPGHFGTLVSLTSNVTGICQVANGCSGVGSLTGLVVGNGTSPFTTVALPAGVVVGTTDLQTLSGKRIVKRVALLNAVANVIQFNADALDMVHIPALGASTTFANPLGTLTDGQVILYRVLTVNPQGVTWGSLYRGTVAVPLPTTTTGSGKEDYFAFIYNLDANKLDFQPMLGGF